MESVKRQINWGELYQIPLGSRIYEWIFNCAFSAVLVSRSRVGGKARDI